MGTPKLTPDLIAGLPKASAADPIALYRRPLLGRLFFEHVNRGLGMLPPRRFEAVLEIGYGAGALQAALAPCAEALHGIDQEPDPGAVAAALGASGVRTNLIRGSATDLPYADERFDLVVSFSVFHRLHDYRRALCEAARVLRPSSYFLLGAPAVSRLLDTGLAALGLGAPTAPAATPAELSDAFHEAGFRLLGTNDLALRPHPLAHRTVGPALYHNWLLTRLRAR